MSLDAEKIIIFFVKYKKVLVLKKIKTIFINEKELEIKVFLK